MENELKNVINNHNVTLFTGRFFRGKSWIISKLEDFLVVDKRESFMRGDTAILAEEELKEIENSFRIAIDEAQIMDHEQLEWILNHVLRERKVLVISCRNYEYIDYLEIFEKSKLNECHFAHVEMKNWDEETKSPIDFKIDRSTHSFS